MAATFTKAAPKQAALKMGIYGPTGSGKTFTALLFAEGLAAYAGGRVAYVDSESGTDFYAKAVKERHVHPEAFDFDALYTRSLADVTEAVASLDPAVHKAIVIDSISHLWEAAIEAYEGKLTGANTIPLQAWGAIKKPYKSLIKVLLDSPLHVIICGRQKNIFEDDDGQLKKVGVGMKAEGETEYEPHITFRMTTPKAKEGGRATVLLYAEKDRTGVLAGRTFPNPDFKTIEPLLSLLGDEQRVTDDEDERQEKDAELLSAEQDKKAKKGAKSAKLLGEFQAAVAAAQDTDDLAKVQKEIKKQRRYMTEDHLGVLRVLFDNKRSEVVAATVGEV